MVAYSTHTPICSKISMLCIFYLQGGAPQYVMKSSQSIPVHS